jgi:methylmalonyl-CoA mutase N-terminal domain/subunit
MRDIEDLRKAMEDWSRRTGERLSSSPERQRRFETGSGVEVARLYTPIDLEERRYMSDQGLPGEYPFTRGIQPTMYRGRLWTMRQYAGFGTAEESNRRYKYLIEQGQSGLSVAFDLPTQMGYDSDHPMAEGEVGRVGVAVDSLADMETLFKDIPLDTVSTSMTINAPAMVILAMYLAVAEQQGVAPDRLEGTVQNDILKEYTARGTYIFPPEPSMRLVVDCIEYCLKTVPKWNPISISGYHIREAGATASQELAFTLADGVAYVEAARRRGLAVDDFAPRLSFFFAAHNDLFEEVAKFRAARRLWSRIMRERFGAESGRSLMLRFHAQTAGSTLTAQQPHNNITRVAIQALAAVLGGAQSLHTNSYDEALELPSEESVRIALRTQQIIAFESGAALTVDPLGGSYYVESLTNRIEHEVLEYLRRIDEIGGAVAAVESGYMQSKIEESAYAQQKAVESGDRIVVGVNKYRSEEKAQHGIQRVDSGIDRRQIEALRELRERRDRDRVRAALRAVETRAGSGENLMPAILDAVRAYATLGEICDVLRKVFGEYRPGTV